MTKADAIAAAIKATGFDRMAQDYLDRPELRDRIIQLMRRNIANDPRFGEDYARRFARLCDPALL